MRVTERLIYEQALSDITGLRSQLFDLQRQASTGKKFHAIEEDPTAAERVRRIQAAKKATLDYETNISRSRTQLQAVDSALGDATNIAIRAKEIAMAMATDTVTGEERDIMAGEVEGLFDSLLTIANTEAGGKYVFGGHQTDAMPFDSAGSFVGDDGMTEVEVGPNTKLEVNVSGDGTFGVSSGLDVFFELNALKEALENDDLPAIRNAIETMATAANQLTQYRADAGIKLSRLDVADGVNRRLHDAYLTEESSLLDVDSVEVLMGLSATTSALENAIAVAQRVTSTSLLNV